MANMHTENEPGNPQHVPVLRAEIVELFAPAVNAVAEPWIVDGTLGLGGHSCALLEAFPSLSVLAIDQDPTAIERSRRVLAPFERRVRLRHARQSGLSRLIRKEQIVRPIGMLLDLGVSSPQLDEPTRGFSFQTDGPLDMRMDPTRDRTAADIVNHWDESDLADLFFHEGGERRSRVIARALVAGRRRAPFLRTLALADTIARALGESSGSGRIHPATQCFQALRRAVNEEGEELRAALEAAQVWIEHGGRLVVISFHSGEDGEVKRFLASGVRAHEWHALTKKPRAAGQAERHANPRARSARLRAAERVRAAEGAGAP
ncbi:MAG: 16S rRNA (cytosine(1402)-N(4))-methyltransferase RsmH [Planctomycetota bacterium]